MIISETLADGWEPVIFGYAGGLQERDTGLIRFGARDYDPMVGRWTSKEPLGFNGSSNFYVYAENDPVNLIDVSGLEPHHCYSNIDIAYLNAMVDIDAMTTDPKNRTEGGEGWEWGSVLYKGTNSKGEVCYSYTTLQSQEDPGYVSLGNLITRFEQETGGKGKAEGLILLHSHPRGGELNDVDKKAAWGYRMSVMAMRYKNFVIDEIQFDMKHRNEHLKSIGFNPEEKGIHRRMRGR
jgi:RHS repeat-associated protein